MAEPKHQMLKIKEGLYIPEQVIRNVIVPFLDAQSLFAFSLTCKHNRKQYTDKKVAADMLHCVLNPTQPNQARFVKLLSI